MEFWIKFNGLKITEYFYPIEIKGRSVNGNEITSQVIPNRHGSYFRKKRKPSRLISVRGIIVNDSDEQLRTTLDLLNDVLDTEKPQPLEFSDEPDMHYMAILDSANDGGEVNGKHFFTISFFVHDPFKYGLEDSSTFSGNTALIENKGTAPAHPTFEMDVLENLTHLDVVREDGEYMRIGQPAPIDVTPFQPLTLVMDDPCTSTVGWTTASEVDNGYVEGEIVASSDGFAPSLFGSAIQPYEWQGPSLVRSIGQSLTDYRMDVEVELQNVNKGTGMIEVYLRDASNNVVAKIGIEDIWRTTDKVQAKMKLGNAEDPNQVEYYTEADYDYGWNDFKGIMRIHSHNFTEDGSRRIRPYFALVRPDGVHDWVRARYVYIDKQNDFGQPITQVQIAFRVWAPATQKADMFIRGIKIWEYNEDPVSLPYLAQPGDKVVFDHKTGDVLINGENRKTEKDFGSSFFDLPPGYTNLYTYPEGAFNTTVKWRPAYK